ncbi:hypothetical protein BC828DRAFT_374051 [Blastocladiella britannica]|nr:hypothetical protein BC828DRAFT_374051 [Blastocladiella britannica]
MEIAAHPSSGPITPTAGNAAKIKEWLASPAFQSRIRSLAAAVCADPHCEQHAATAALERVAADLSSWFAAHAALDSTLREKLAMALLLGSAHVLATVPACKLVSHAEWCGAWGQAIMEWIALARRILLVPPLLQVDDTIRNPLTALAEQSTMAARIRERAIKLLLVLIDTTTNNGNAGGAAIKSLKARLGTQTLARLFAILEDAGDVPLAKITAELIFRLLPLAPSQRSLALKRATRQGSFWASWFVSVDGRTFAMDLQARLDEYYSRQLTARSNSNPVWFSLSMATVTEEAVAYVYDRSAAGASPQAARIEVGRDRIVVDATWVHHNNQSARLALDIDYHAIQSCWLHDIGSDPAVERWPTLSLVIDPGRALSNARVLVKHPQIVSISFTTHNDLASAHGVIRDRCSAQSGGLATKISAFAEALPVHPHPGNVHERAVQFVMPSSSAEHETEVHPVAAQSPPLPPMAMESDTRSLSPTIVSRAIDQPRTERQQQQQHQKQQQQPQQQRKVVAKRVVGSSTPPPVPAPSRTPRASLKRLSPPRSVLTAIEPSRKRSRPSPGQSALPMQRATRSPTRGTDLIDFSKYRPSTAPEPAPAPSPVRAQSLSPIGQLKYEPELPPPAPVVAATVLTPLPALPHPAADTSASLAPAVDVSAPKAAASESASESALIRKELDEIKATLRLLVSAQQGQQAQRQPLTPQAQSPAMRTLMHTGLASPQTLPRLMPRGGPPTPLMHSFGAPPSPGRSSSLLYPTPSRLRRTSAMFTFPTLQQQQQPPLEFDCAPPKAAVADVYAEIGRILGVRLEEQYQAQSVHVEQVVANLDASLAAWIGNWASDTLRTIDGLQNRVRQATCESLKGYSGGGGKGWIDAAAQ